MCQAPKKATQVPQREKRVLRDKGAKFRDKGLLLSKIQYKGKAQNSLLQGKTQNNQSLGKDLKFQNLQLTDLDL